MSILDGGILGRTAKKVELFEGDIVCSIPMITYDSESSAFSPANVVFNSSMTPRLGSTRIPFTYTRSTTELTMSRKARLDIELETDTILTTSPSTRGARMNIVAQIKIGTNAWKDIGSSINLSLHAGGGDTGHLGARHTETIDKDTVVKFRIVVLGNAHNAGRAAFSAVILTINELTINE